MATGRECSGGGNEGTAGSNDQFVQRRALDLVVRVVEDRIATTALGVLRQLGRRIGEDCRGAAEWTIHDEDRLVIIKPVPRLDAEPHAFDGGQLFSRGVNH